LKSRPQIVIDLPVPTLKLLGLPIANNKSTSLTDAQLPEEQLRFFQQDRVFRLLRDLAIRLAERDNPPVTIPASDEAISSAPVQYFLQELERLSIPISFSKKSSGKNELNLLLTGQWISERLCVGDTWSALNTIRSHPELSLALQGKTEEAETGFKKWFTLGTLANKAWALYSIAMPCARHHDSYNRSLDKAEALLNEAFEILSRDELKEVPDLNFYRIFNRNGHARVLFRRGKISEAKEVLKKCATSLGNEKNHLRLHKSVLVCNLAQCEVALGEIGSARASYEELIRLDPDYAENRIEFAHLLIECEEFEAALVQIEKAIELDSSIGTAWETRAKISKLKGDFHVS